MYSMKMDNITKFYITAILILSMSQVVSGFSSKKVIINKKFREGVYYTKEHGGIYCGEAELTPCGVTLRKCGALMYYCLRDVSMLEEMESKE